MRSKRLWAVGAGLVCVLTWSVLTTAQSTGVQADYDRAYSLAARTRNKIYDSVEAPTWIPGTEKVWYRKTVKGGNAFVLVDAVAGTKGPAFDQDKLAATLSTAAGASYTGVTLPFATF